VLGLRKKLFGAGVAFAFDDETRLLPTGDYAGRGGNFFIKRIYEAENAENRAGGRFRWIVSTCLAATVGAIAILVVGKASAIKTIPNQ
jgi:hypothetical protein